MTARNVLMTSVVAAIAAHVLFIVVTSPHAVPTSQSHFDARQYRELADSLAAGEGFVLSRKGGRGPDLTRTPIYPIFVSAFGSGWDPVPTVLVAQHLLVLVTAWLTWWWVRSRAGEPFAAAIAFALVALDLTTMTYASYLLTEALFTFLLTVAIVAWPLPGDSRPGARAALAGVAWGLATLTRPITFYLAPLALLVTLAAARKRPGVIGPALVAIVCGGIVTGTWMARNHALSGSAVLSTIEGENLLHYRAALVSLPADKSVAEWRRELRHATDEGRFDHNDPRQAAELDAAKKKKAMELLKSHPLGLHRPLVLGFPRLYFSPNRTYLYNLLGIEHAQWDLNAVGESSMTERLVSREMLYLAPSLAYQTLLFMATLAGAVVAWRRRAAWTLVAVLVLAYMTVLSTGLETHARFRVPMIPPMAALAALAADAWRTRRLGASDRQS
jgi:hypothetical protein